MLRAISLIRRADRGHRIAVDTITLDRAQRYRRRIALSSDGGHAFLLDLPEGLFELNDLAGIPAGPPTETETNFFTNLRERLKAKTAPSDKA